MVHMHGAMGEWTPSSTLICWRTEGANSGVYRPGLDGLVPDPLYKHKRNQSWQGWFLPCIVVSALPPFIRRINYSPMVFQSRKAKQLEVRLSAIAHTPSNLKHPRTVGL